MVPVNIMEDENLREVLDNILSGILNTKDVDEDSPTLTRLLNMTFSYVNLDEMEMEYYVLFSYLHELNKLLVSDLNIRPSLNRDTLDRILTNDLPSLIRKPQVRLKNWLKMQGMEYNLDVTTNAEDAMSKLYQRVMSLYDSCIERGLKPDDVLAEEIALSKAYINNVSTSIVNYQVTILNSELKLGRKRFSGPDGWLEFTQLVSADIQRRLLDAKSESTFIDSIEDVKKIFKGSSESLSRLASYSVPVLDDMMMLNRHRLVTVCALENVGKTKFLVYTATKVLLAGHKVRIMYGESQKSLLLADIMVSYIYHKHKIYVRPQEIISLNDTDLEEDVDIPEDIRRIINKCMIEIIERKQLVLVPSYSYDSLYEELKRDYETRQFDFLGIDHTCTLSGEGELKENLDKLAYALREFKRNYPVCIMALSQLSTAAKNDLTAGKLVGNSPTKGSATLSQESDVMLILNDKGAMVSKGLVSVQVYKVRGVDKPERLIMLKKDFSVSNFIYDVKLQLVDDNSIQQEEALEKISLLYNNESLDDSNILQQGFFLDLLGDDDDEEDDDSGFFVGDSFVNGETLVLGDDDDYEDEY